MGDAGEGTAASFPAIGTGGGVVDAWGTAGDDAGGGDGGEVLEPQAGGFGFWVAVLPGVDDLVGFADVGGDDADGVFEGDAGNGGLEQGAHEVEGLGLLRAAGGEPPGTGDGEERTGWVSDHQVPAVP